MHKSLHMKQDSRCFKISNQAATSTSHPLTWPLEVVEAIVAVEETEAATAGVVVLVGATLLEQTQEDKALPSRSAKFVIDLTTLLLSVGIGLRRITSPTTTKTMQGSRHLDIVWTRIGMLTAAPLIISLANLTS
jgi:hypothetical protein